MTKKCEFCGADFTPNVSNQKYCRECQSSAKEYMRRKYAEKQRKEVYTNVYNKQEPRPKKVKMRDKEYELNHPCLTLCRTCLYRGKVNGTTCCNFLEIKGRMRGCEARDCREYVRSTKGERRKITKRLG